MSVTAPPASAPRRAPRRRSSLFTRGEPMVWLTGSALALSLLMVAGLLAIVAARGGSAFWPGRLLRIETVDGGALLGEPIQTETFRPEAHVFEAIADPAQRAAAQARVDAQAGRIERQFLRTGNLSSGDSAGAAFRWVQDIEVVRTTQPEWAVTVERREWGRFHGVLSGFVEDGERTQDTPEAAWAGFEARHAGARAAAEEAESIVEGVVAPLDLELEQGRLGVRAAEREHGADAPQANAARARLADLEERLAPRRAEALARVEELRASSRRCALLFETADGGEQQVQLVDVVRAYPANRLGWGGRLAVWASRWWEFFTADPREANTEGGVWPAIFGTIVLTLIMTLLVVPFGVLGALYLREYARQGRLVSLVRIAVNNLAGVPSIVFGVFGFGFFCYVVGGGIDQVFFADKLPNPTYGKGGILWASLTLALLTLPVVIVATEEALAAVPNSLREGSYACGASRWQTIRRIVLPRAMPGVMTGVVLAIARGAGEVAPIMLVGAAKSAPALPVDGAFPFVHPERSFMHLGFHIYDLGFQSPDAKAAEPLVFTTTLLLIGIVVVLNMVAIGIRSRLRRRFAEAA